MTKNIRVLHIDSNEQGVGLFPVELSVYELDTDISITCYEDELVMVPLALTKYWEQLNELIENSKPIMSMVFRGFTPEMGNNSPILPDDTFIVDPPEIAFNNLLYSVMKMTNADLVHSTIW